MINFDSLTLKALTDEIGPVLESGRVQKVQQPSRNEILLGIRTQGKNLKLYINVNPKYPHLTLLTKQGEDYRSIEIPQKPPMFCMLLRKHMEGAKIKTVSHPKYERILEIYFDSYNELGERVPLVLACELMGKYSNIILYSYENNVILGSAHHVGPEKSREREVAGGLPYIYPPKPKKMDLLKISEAEFYTHTMAIPGPMNIWLNENFNYISLALATELCKITGIDIEKDKVIAIPKEKINALYHLIIKTLKLENLNPSISKDMKLFSLIGLDPDIEWEQTDSVNSMVDLYFGYQYYLDAFSRLKSMLLTAAKKEIKKEKARLSQHKRTLESEEKSEKYRQYADIIMANLHKIQPGQDSVELENFYDNNQLIIIQLDPVKSPNANAQRYYKLYNKAKTASRISKDIVRQVQEELDYLESIETFINQSDSLADLKQIKDELISQNLLKTTGKQIKSPEKLKKEGISLSEYTSTDGYKIYVGKNNRQNEYLISKIASPNDIWLHTQNIPGSHVLIKINDENVEVPASTIEEAASIAAYFSQAKNSANVAVIYVRRKFLKKPPHSKPGYVTYTNEKTLIVNPDKDLVKNLS
ncbi:MAG: hypothetical protein ACD_20C00301G0015 [uncultured bacterium]|nr:MAG: hypothetical protein ACD_20C00301G0015 [uncultured bacterium]HBH18599.1 hypothetical protein [Cyanobacteria bacterium UBA9579]